MNTELEELRALKQRVEDAEIALLSGGDRSDIPYKIVNDWFAYIVYGEILVRKTFGFDGESDPLNRR